MNKTYLDIKDCDLDLEVELEEEGSETIRGARDSFMGKAGMGPQISPDEHYAYFTLKSIYMCGYNISSWFDLNDIGEEERMYELIEEGFKAIAGHE